jgi:hypothetical protein
MRFVIVLSLATAVLAQTSSSTGVLTGTLGPVSGGAVSNSTWIVSSVGQGMPGGAVTGVPYSAEEVTEHVQTLADGTHITQPSQKTMYYRDSQGRTRTERTFPLPLGAAVGGAAAPSLIDINDPVSGAHYILDARSRTARKMPSPFAPPPPSPPAPNSASASGIWFNQSGAPVGNRQSNSGSDAQAQHPQFSHESLGTQTIEGILAEGTRTTVVYPVGSMGNDRPITTVHETWMSAELKTVVLSKSSDPRSGESTTKLVNISRTEPDPSLFQIPSDYEIDDSQSPVRNR